MSPTGRTRRVEKAVDIAASPEAVWDAITTGPGLSNWFVLDARCAEGKGATQWVSWGPDEEAEFTIGAWEPHRRLRIFIAGDDGKPLPEWPSIVEYTIEARDGALRVRLVESDIPDTDAWDSVYDGVSVGWTMYLATLQHVVENHPEATRRAVSFTQQTPGEPDDVWRRLTGAEGLALRLDTEADAPRTVHIPGEGQTVTVAGVVDPPRVLTLRLPELGDSFLAAALHRTDPGVYINLVLSLFEIDAERAERIDAACHERLAQAFPSP